MVTTVPLRTFVGVVGRFCSNILTNEVVGGIEDSSVGLDSDTSDTFRSTLDAAG